MQFNPCSVINLNTASLRAVSWFFCEEDPWHGEIYTDSWAEWVGRRMTKDVVVSELFIGTKFVPLPESGPDAAAGYARQIKQRIAEALLAGLIRL